MRAVRAARAVRANTGRSWRAPRAAWTPAPRSSSGSTGVAIPARSHRAEVSETCEVEKELSGARRSAPRTVPTLARQRQQFTIGVLPCVYVCVCVCGWRTHRRAVPVHSEFTCCAPNAQSIQRVLESFVLCACSAETVPPVFTACVYLVIILRVMVPFD